MSVFGIIIAVLLLIILCYFGYRQINGIIEGVKERKQQKLEKEKEVQEDVNKEEK